MKYYTLSYVYENDPNTGCILQEQIIKTTNKEQVEELIEKHNIKYVTKLEWGMSHVFLYQENNPDNLFFYDEHRLHKALKEDKKFNKENN